MHYFRDKIAVVTGAGSGIGRELAVQLNSAGCEIYISDINSEALEGTRALLTNTGAAAHLEVIDAADKAAMHAWAERIGAEKGHVDIVINNAGVGLLSRVEETAYEDIEWLMGINFWGVVYGTRAFLPLLHKSREANLINISSVFGLFAVPTQSAYNAAKFAVRGYTEALRQELADSTITVCCVHPGGIKTNIARSARVSNPTQSAEDRGNEFEKLAPTTAQSAAAQILRGAQRKKPRVLVGWDAKVLSVLTRLFPVRYPVLVGWFLRLSDTKAE